MIDTFPVSYPLFGRSYKLSVTASMDVLGDAIIDIEKLDIRFNIKRTLTKEANTGEITVYNLSEGSRGDISSIKSAAVVLEAGYEGARKIIFAGDVREINSERDEADWLTTFRAGDGKKKLKKKRIEKSIRGPVLLSTVLREFASSIGFPLSHGSEILLADPTLKLEFANNTLLYGYKASGKAAKVLDTLLESTGLEWSIQNGEMQILTRGKPISPEVIVLTPESGLLESPKISGDKILTCKSLLIPEIAPGRLIRVKSAFVDGSFRVQTAKYTGSTFGNEWYIEMEAEAQ